VAEIEHPGVFVEEIPRGPRPIEGVPTSITTFVGRTWRGPLDEPVHLGSFGDYERQFGGLWPESTMSFAVYQYFQNGGGDAIIVRIHNNAIVGKATADGAEFEAASPGRWAEKVRIRIDHDIDPDVVKANTADSMFNLRVKDLKTGSLEVHRNLSFESSHPRFVSAVATQLRALRELGVVKTLATLA